MTKRYGILAYPAKHSLSPAIHNAAFRALGIDANFEYFETLESQFDEFMRSLTEKDISGLAVSLPYKESVMQYLDFVDAAAKEIGAVNTIINRDGKLCGYNTDYIGVIKSLKEKIDSLAGKQCIVVGAGGASRAVIYGLLKEGAVVSVYNRSRKKAEDLAGYFENIFGVEVKSGNLLDMLEVEGDILINTTSIWLNNESIPLDSLMPDDYVGNFRAVMDIVYKPLITPLIFTAQKWGLVTITGDKMFLYQAAEQFHLWTGKEAPLDLMREALKEKL